MVHWGVTQPKVSLRARTATLRDGAPVVTRPITPADAPALTRGLSRLSPEGNAYRFLHHRKQFSAAELNYLTHCDFVDHVALVLASLNGDGREVDQVGVARCIREPDDPTAAEVAIVFVDEWQRRGAGTALLGHLADLARSAGIARWRAHILDGNESAERLLARFGREIARARPGFGISQVTYLLS